jgi:hypothetical protein
MAELRAPRVPAIEDLISYHTKRARNQAGRTPQFRHVPENAGTYQLSACAAADRTNIDQFRRPHLPLSEFLYYTRNKYSE